MREESPGASRRGGMVILLLLCSINLLAVRALAQGPPQQVPYIEDNWNLAIGQIAMLFTTIAGFIWNAYREARNRRWDLEDRARLAADLRSDQAQLSVKVVEQQEKMATKVIEQQEKLAGRVVQQQEVIKAESDQKQAEILGKLDENTEISKSAFKEANDTNKKIADVHGRITTLLSEYDKVKGRTKALEQKNEHDQT